MQPTASQAVVASATISLDHYTKILWFQLTSLALVENSVVSSILPVADILILQRRDFISLRFGMGLSFLLMELGTFSRMDSIRIRSSMLTQTYSAATPTAASVISLVNDALLGAGKPVLGFLNPWLYSVGYKTFTDITDGSAIGCNTTGFPAQAGWDAVTGFGTPVRSQKACFMRSIHSLVTNSISRNSKLRLWIMEFGECGCSHV
jgi:hypothetical protein